MRVLMTVVLGPLLLLTLGCGGSRSPGTEGSPIMVIDSVAAPEGSLQEDGKLQFRVALDRASEEPISLSWMTQDGDARAGQDYQAAQGQLEMAPGVTRAEIRIDLIGDDELEPARKFSLVVNDVVGAELVSEEIQGTVANDDNACLPPLPGAENPWLDRRPLNFAHRGGVIDFPENTLFAYKQAWAAGADVLEMDVYQTSDGELVILHDLTIDRTTNGSGDVGDFTLAELREFDAAYWFVPGRGTPHDADPEDYVYRGVATGDQLPPLGFSREDFRIPTLEEALRAFPDALINVELKPDADGTGSYEGQTARLLLDYGRIEDVMVASFVDTAATAFKLQAPCISMSVPLAQAAALILASEGPLPIVNPGLYQAFQVPPDTSQVSQVPEQVLIEVVDQDFVDDAHAAGMAVHVWSINDCPTMLSLLNLGVDAVMTDRPILLEALLNQAEDQRSCEGL